MSPAIIASLITGGSTLASVFLATSLQTRRIDRDNKAALNQQTGEIKQHLKGGPE